jgi:hypothetical protein
MRSDGLKRNARLQRLLLLRGHPLAWAVSLSAPRCPVLTAGLALSAVILLRWPRLQMEDFEKSKAFLKQAGPNGLSLYDHLTDTLLHIVKEKPADTLGSVRQHVSSCRSRASRVLTVWLCGVVWGGQFEKLSVQVKQNKLNPPLLKELDSKDDKKDSKDPKACASPACVAALSLVVWVVLTSCLVPLFSLVRLRLLRSRPRPMHRLCSSPP